MYNIIYIIYKIINKYLSKLNFEKLKSYKIIEKRLCLLTKRSGQREKMQTDLSKDPEAKSFPSQLHPTLCTFAE